ncbi:MAG: LysM peptidoglycan-binding domain-containing protein, partial [Lachnospiraceae bacterium]|nr:LysM peptidoglycan-binding domain-containing protein [Lachnospiraceae bacterium]
AAWGLGAALFVLLLFAGNLLLKSMDRIQAMEEAIQTISGSYDTKTLAKQQDEASPSAGMTAPGQTPALTQTTAPDQTGTPMRTAAPTQTVGAARTAVPTQVPGAAQAATTPMPSSQMESYVVKKGDTLSQIVWKQYHSFAYMDRVLHTNRIKNGDEIFIGQCILLPEP